MRLDDLLFTQGFGTRYDCRHIVLSGAISIDGIVHDDPDEEVSCEGLVFHIAAKSGPISKRRSLRLISLLATSVR